MRSCLLADGFARFCEAIEAVVGDREEEVRATHGRLLLNGLRKSLRGLFVPTEARVGKTQVQVCLCEVRGLLRDLLKVGNGLLGLIPLEFLSSVFERLEGRRRRTTGVVRGLRPQGSAGGAAHKADQTNQPFHWNSTSAISLSHAKKLRSEAISEDKLPDGS